MAQWQSIHLSIEKLHNEFTATGILRRAHEARGLISAVWLGAHTRHAVSGFI